MYEPHPDFRIPDRSTVIWRYLDFTKLISLLDSRKLYFARAADLFKEDPFEGSYPRSTDSAVSFPGLENTPQGLEVITKQRQFSKNNRYFIYVNCWHMNPHESAAMWKVYLKSDEGVAIQSDVGRLCDSFTGPESILVTPIVYLDYTKDSFKTGNVLQPFTHKRKSFEYEHELRAFYWLTDSVGEMLNTTNDVKPDVTPVKMEFDVDLSKLIQRVYVAPTCKPWFHRLVEQVLDKYGPKVQVHHSDLSKDPVW